MTAALFVTTEPLRGLPAEFLREASRHPVTVLHLHESEGDDRLPAGWRHVAPEELVAADSVRRRFLDFLDDWPDLAGGPAGSVDERFTVNGRYSVWWTSVGADRQATHGIFKFFRYAALVDRAIERLAPPAIWVFTAQPHLARLVESRAARARIDVRRVPGTHVDDARRAADIRWVVRSIRRAALAPLETMSSAFRCRSAARSASLYRASGRPVVVFASRFPRYLEIREGRFAPINWREICAALESIEPPPDQAFLPWSVNQVADVDAQGRSRREGIDALRGLHAPLLVREQFVPLRGHAGRFVRQLSATWRFFWLARQARFRAAFAFAGADMSPVIMPALLDAIHGMTDWSLRQAQYAAALRAAGDVRAVVMSEELYRQPMPLLAAAAGLGIPTVGVQHGTIMPSHLIYTPPKGHVRHAPLPDYFAAYGAYAKATLSGHGAYPADRVWETGAARLDPLVNTLADRAAARAAAGLPADRKVVVLATQTFPWFASVIRAVLECMREHPEAVLCIRKHPSGRAMPVEAIQTLAQQVGAGDVRSFGGDIALLLAACDVWVSASSTTILEATLAGRRTICVNFSGEPDGYPYVEDGASLPARSVEELRTSLDSALRSTVGEEALASRTAFLRRHAGPTAEGRAAFAFRDRLAAILSRA